MSKMILFWLYLLNICNRFNCTSKYVFVNLLLYLKKSINVNYDNL